MKNVSYVFKKLIAQSEVTQLSTDDGLYHPIMYVLSDEKELIESTNYNKYTQCNTKKAISTIDELDPKFLKKAKETLISKNRVNASAALGEIRCYGILLDLFGKNFVTHLKEKANIKTPDFKVTYENVDIYIEVKTIQIDHTEAESLFDFENDNSSHMREHIIHPYGIKRKSGTTPSVIYKLCSIKQKAEQLSNTAPSIIWVDVQDMYMNGITDRIEIANPIYEGRHISGVDGIRSNEIWYSLYAEEKMLIFDGETSDPNEGGIKCTLPQMQFDGRFHNQESSKVSAVIFNGANALAIYENPFALNPLPRNFIEKISSWITFKMDGSKINLPNKPLFEALKTDKNMIEKLNKKSFYSW